MASLAAIEKRSRLDSTVAALTALILSGQVVSGDLLPSEAELCRQLGVSRATVREAVRVLQSRGMVESEVGIGIRVCDRTERVAADSIARMLDRKGAGAHDILEVRLMLDGQAAALAAERATEDDITAISAAIAAMREQPRSQAENASLDFDFHVCVAEASHNVVLMTLVNAIRHLLSDTITATHALDPRVESRITRHSEVLDGIRRRDPVAARRAMERHLEDTKELVGIIEATDRSRKAGDTSGISPTHRRPFH